MYTYNGYKLKYNRASGSSCKCSDPLWSLYRITDFLDPRFSKTSVLVKPGMWKYRSRFDYSNPICNLANLP